MTTLQSFIQDLTSLYNDNTHLRLANEELSNELTKLSKLHSANEIELQQLRQDNAAMAKFNKTLSKTIAGQNELIEQLKQQYSAVSSKLQAIQGVLK